MDRYVVAGNPVEHSQSPFIHAEFARQTGQTLEYGRLLWPRDGFDESVRALAASGAKGCNITVPFKFDAFRAGQRCTERAALAQAANVLCFDPQGWLADKILGEKEMLVSGFFLMGISCLAIPYLASFHLGLWWWAALLFVGRTGASTVETMAEVYFFKQIDGHNASYIGSFRRTRPLAFIVAPLLASALLQFEFITLGGLFVLLGLVMLVALYFPIGLKDTR